MSYLSKWFSTKKTPQTAPIPGTSQVANSGGGYAFTVDDWTRLDRFLILGSESGSYYATERKLTRENAEGVLRCLALDGRRVVATASQDDPHQVRAAAVLHVNHQFRVTEMPGQHVAQT